MYLLETARHVDAFAGRTALEHQGALRIQTIGRDRIAYQRRNIAENEALFLRYTFTIAGALNGPAKAIAASFRKHFT